LLKKNYIWLNNVNNITMKNILYLIVIMLMYSCSDNTKSHINKTISHDNIILSDDVQIDDVQIDDVQIDDVQIDDYSQHSENIFTLQVVDDLTWRNELIGTNHGKFIYGYHKLLKTDNMVELEYYQKYDTKHSTQDHFVVEFEHVRFKHKYVANVIKSKVLIIYSEDVKYPIILFTWSRSTSTNNIYSYLKSIRGCKIILPIGYNKYDINE